MATEAAGKENPMTSQAPKPQRSVFMAAHVVLRILAMAFAIAAMSVMLTSTQTVYFFGIGFKARYSYSSAFKFLFVADAVVCGFSLLSLFFVCLSTRKLKTSTSSSPKCFFFLFLHDMVMTLLIISGCAAATAIGYVGRYGQEMMGWSALCDRVAEFCRSILVAVALSYLTFFAYLALTVMSAYKLSSQIPIE